MTTAPASYSRIHGRLIQYRGFAYNQICPCGSPAAGWAYQHTGDPELRDENGQHPHSMNMDDYVAMCQSCHRRLDNERDPRVATERLRECGRQLAESTNNRRRRCLECGFVASPGGMGKHRLSSGHAGYEDLPG